MDKIRFNDEDRKKLFYDYVRNHSMFLIDLSRKLRIGKTTVGDYARGARAIPLDIANEICRLNKVALNDLNVEKFHDNCSSKFGFLGHINNLGHYARARDIGEIKLSPELAEFIGIYLGDGTLTRYFVRIVGDIRYDKPYFAYITNLVSKIFNLHPNITLQKPNTALLTVLSTMMCKLLNEKYKLGFGDKKRNLTVIPDDIFNDDKLVLHCLRGIVDTDGCLGKSGCNFKLTVCSHNPALLKQLDEINQRYGFFNRCYGQKLETCSVDKARKYMALVGSSNLRHIVRFCEKVRNDRLLYRSEVLNYYERYKSINLPFYEPVV